MAVVSIFSGSYCDGEVIADKVSQVLGYRDISKHLLQETADRYDTTVPRLEKALSGSSSLFDNLTHERDKHIAYLKLVLAELVLADNLILTGCAGHLLPRTIAHVLRVCVIANVDYRIKRVMQEAGESEKEARKTIHRDDQSKLACTSFLLDKPAYDESLYDIVIPTHETVIDEAVALIEKHALSDAVRTTPRSQRAADDFVLATRANLVLVEAGHVVDVLAEHGQVTLLINQYVMRMKRHREQLIEVVGKVVDPDKVTVRLGPKYNPPSINPWANIEGPPKILLVDDEKDFVHTLSERLQTRSLNSSVAYDGEQALAMLEKDAPDVMVLDLMMPGIDGIEVLRRVKREHPEVEVIILTGHGSEHEREQAEELGAFAYLQKPANLDILARVMKEAYEKVNQRRAAAGQTRTEDTE